MLTVVIAAYNVAGFPEGGGHFSVYLQYVLGLRQLGCDVYWLEGFRSKGRAEREAPALAVFRARMKQYGLAGRCILYSTNGLASAPEPPLEYLDMSREEAEAIFERADLLLNFHYAINPGLLARFRRAALIDIDPGLLQFWISRGQLNVPPHHCYFTIGEGVARRSVRIPDLGVSWIAIRPAVSLDHWPVAFTPEAKAFTTVSIWDSSDWIVDEHERYENTKRVAYLEFAGLPNFTPQALELALFLRTDRDMEELCTLQEDGWSIRHSREVASTPEAYQRYIQQSRGEFSCAKPSYVRFQTGWVSDRTVCYLASGKPVVVQDTGPVSFLPHGEGVFRFRTVAEAADAFEAINRDYKHHCEAARQIAEAWFDAKKVLEKVLSCALP